MIAGTSPWLRGNVLPGNDNSMLPYGVRSWRLRGLCSGIYAEKYCVGDICAHTVLNLTCLRVSVCVCMCVRVGVCACVPSF